MVSAVTSRTRWCGSLLALWAAVAVGAEPLPDPLTLEYALSLAQESHPELEIARSGVQRARSGVALEDASQNVKVSIEARARWVEPPEDFPDQDHDDHKASLFVRKELYDFGRSAALERAAQDQLRAAEARYQDAVSRRRVAIMERYFAVLLADKEFNRLDEAMAVSYVTVDRLRQKRELGQVSELDLRAAESAYQTARRVRYAAEGQQRLTRNALAEALNRPGQLSANLASPPLPLLQRNLPEAPALLAAAAARNPALLALRAGVEAAQQRVAAARARPRLSGELESSAYSRSLASNDQFRAAILVEIPLYTGGAVPALTDQRQAELDEASARQRQAEAELRQAVLELHQQLQTLAAQRQEAAALRDYREIYLERSRTVYEQEVQADLGDAMVRLTEAELAVMRADFETVLAWERLDALTGGPVVVE